MGVLKLIFPLAWRNLWRHRRRTLLTMFSILLAVTSMVALGAFMRAWADSALQEAVGNLTGHGQVHAPGYLEDPAIERRLSGIPGDLQAALEVAAVEAWSARVRVPAMLLSERESAPVELVGIDPDRERGLSFIAAAVAEGQFLVADPTPGILLGRTLVERLRTRLGRRLVVMTQGADGSLKEQGFRITGVFESRLAQEKLYAFVSIGEARQLLGIGAGLTEISYRLRAQEQASDYSAKLQALAPDLDIRSWKELEPFTWAIQQMSEGTILIWILVSFTVVAFGLVNTLLMAVFERLREFGLLQALGMSPHWLLVLVVLEALLMVGLSILLGVLLGSGLIVLLKDGLDLGVGASYLGAGRVLYPRLDLGETLFIALAVMFLALLASLYPAFKAARAVPVQMLTRPLL